MGFCKFCKDLTTGKDNETHDVVRVSMVFIVGGLIGALFIGSTVYVLSYAYLLFNFDLLAKDGAKISVFDIQTFFNATGTFAITTGGFLASGAGALLLKNKTEPDALETTKTLIKSGDGAEEPKIEVTKVTQANNAGQ